MRLQERVRQVLWILFLLVHGGAIVFTALPKTSLRESLQPQLELPGMWSLESCFVKITQLNPLQRPLERYCSLLGIVESWYTFAPVPPFEQKLLRVVAELEDGQLLLLWTGPRSIWGLGLGEFRVRKFLEYVVREEPVRYMFLHHFLKQVPRAKRVVLLLERVTVATPTKPPQTTGEYIFFTVTPEDAARFSRQ